MDALAALLTPYYKKGGDNMADFRGYMIGSFASSRLDRGGIPVVATTERYLTLLQYEPTVDFGINPCQWNSLPPEGILLWKVRHPVTETEASYPATIVLPSGLSTTTPRYGIQRRGYRQQDTYSG